jgi:hypothetical protein
MRIVAPFALTGLLFQLTTCNKPPAYQRPEPPIHRFENISGVNGDGVALDTVTGQWCRTWQWVYKDNSQIGGLDQLPTCESLYNKTNAQQVKEFIQHLPSK